MEWIKCLVNGEEYPNKQTLELVNNNGTKGMDGHNRFLESLAAHKEGKRVMLNLDMWHRYRPHRRV